MRAAPRGGRHQLHLPLRRMSSEEGGEVLDPHAGAPLQLPQQPRQRHLAEAVMVAVRLPVRRDRHEPRLAPRLPRRDQPLRPRGRIGEQRPERHVVGERPVVHEQGNRPTAGRAVPPRHPVRGRALHLMGREDRELDPFGREDIEGLRIDRRLRQPHADRLASETAAEVRDPPAYLGHLVAVRGERQDHVVVGHGHGVPVPVVLLAAHAVRLQHGRVGRGRRPLQPLEQRGAEVEAHRGERVDDARDPSVRGVQPGRHDRAVALPLDALVPVVERRGGRLRLDLVEPRILSRRLVEMPVDDDRPDPQPASTSATVSRTFGNSASRRSNSAASVAPPSPPPDEADARAATSRSASPQCRLKRRSA